MVVGIDPGKTGGLAFLDHDGKVEIYPMPNDGKKIIAGEIASILVKMKPARAYIEDVHAFPGQGVTSMFSFGFSTGVIHGILGALNIPLIAVAPQTWKKSVLRDLPKDKQGAFVFCARMFPNVSLIPTGCRTPKDGLADALCIAYYGIEKEKIDYAMQRKGES